MDINQLNNQIQALLNIAKISQEEKDSLLAKLPSATQDQLEKLRINLMKQAAVDIFFDALEEIQREDRLLDESDVEEIENKIVAKFEQTDALIFTEAELSEIRQSIAAMQQKVAGSAPAPSSESTIPQQAPVQNPPVAPVSPQTPPANVPTSPPATTPVSNPQSPAPQVS